MPVLPSLRVPGSATAAVPSQEALEAMEASILAAAASIEENYGLSAAVQVGWGQCLTLQGAECFPPIPAIPTVGHTGGGLAPQGDTWGRLGGRRGGEGRT
jgi:hypothetical protein